MNPYLVERLQPFGTTIFAEMSALAVATGAINLGQGFPDTDGPDEVKQAAIDAIAGGSQPVPAGHRHPRAARARSARHQQRFYGLDYDPDAEVLVTAGATEAIAATLLALLRTRRRGRHVRAVLRLVRGVHRDGGRATARRHAAHARLRLRPRRAARRDHAPHQAHPAQLAAQPDRQGASRRDELTLVAELARGARPRSSSPTRSTSTSSSTASTCRSRRSRACATARSRSLGRARRSRSRAGRSAGSARRPSSSPRSRPPSSSSPT